MVHSVHCSRLGNGACRHPPHVNKSNAMHSVLVVESRGGHAQCESRVGRAGRVSQQHVLPLSACTTGPPTPPALQHPCWCVPGDLLQSYLAEHAVYGLRVESEGGGRSQKCEEAARSEASIHSDYAGCVG